MLKLSFLVFNNYVLKIISWIQLKLSFSFKIYPPASRSSSRIVVRSSRTPLIQFRPSNFSYSSLCCFKDLVQFLISIHGQHRVQQQHCFTNLQSFCWVISRERLIGRELFLCSKIIWSLKKLPKALPTPEYRALPLWLCFLDP